MLIKRPETNSFSQQIIKSQFEPCSMVELQDMKLLF